MKVLLRRNVSKLGKIGDVVEVKSGYARNYLLPEGLATKPTAGNLKAVEAEKQAYLEQVAKEKAVLELKATAVRGKEITIPARANEEGHLYGSVGTAQIAAALGQEGILVEPKMVHMDHPIRKLDKYDVEILFGEDVMATIHVWVVPLHEPGEEPAAEQAADQTPPAQPAGEQ